MWLCNGMKNLPSRVCLAALVVLAAWAPGLPAKDPAPAPEPGRQTPPGAAAGTLETAKGTLLSREAPGAPWRVIGSGEAVPAGALLVGLPGAVVAGQGGAVALTFQTDFDSPLPVLECALTLNASDADGLDLTLDRGRVDLTNRKKAGAARVRLHARGHTWHLALAEPGASLAVELYGLWPLGSRFVKDPGPQDVPPAEMLFLVLRGQADVALEGTQYRLTAPPGPALIFWDSAYGMDQEPKHLDALPPWATRAGRHRTAEEQAQYQAARELFIRVAAEKGADAALDALLNSDQPIDRRVGVIAAGALDELPKLAAFFRHAKHPDLLDTAILVFRHWIGRGPGQDQKMYHALMDKGGFSKLEAESMMQLLHGFGDEDQAEPETYDLLITELNDSRLAIRALAYWNLVRLVPEGKQIAYDPQADKAERQRAQAAWRKLVPEGTVPPAHRPHTAGK